MRQSIERYFWFVTAGFQIIIYITLTYVVHDLFSLFILQEIRKITHNLRKLGHKIK